MAIGHVSRDFGLELELTSAAKRVWGYMTRYERASERVASIALGREALVNL